MCLSNAGQFMFDLRPSRAQLLDGKRERANCTALLKTLRLALFTSQLGKLASPRQQRSRVPQSASMPSSPPSIRGGCVASAVCPCPTAAVGAAAPGAEATYLRRTRPVRPDR